MVSVATTAPQTAREGAVPETEVAALLAAFRRRHGRSPRVLHVGNIANNAYNNAKLLNELGFDCDVLCPDYYHIMACPEWEDADFEGTVSDPAAPRWDEVDLRGFVRPPWFIQGPMWTCIRYLMARRSGHAWRERYWWWVNSRAYGGRLPFAGLRWLWNRTMGLPRALPLFGVLIGLLVAWLIAPGIGIAAAFLGATVVAFHLHRRLQQFMRERRDRFDFAAQVAVLVAAFRRRLPERADSMTAADLNPFRSATPALRELFAHYDLIVAYATHSILPLLAGKRPFVAYEHGTLRDIPFAPDADGRRTALSYIEADAIYMTNADTVVQTRSLQPDSQRITFGIHGFDERRLRRWADALAPESARARRFGVDSEVRLFFSPARHHWKEGFDSWLKGNDRVVRAAQQLAAKHAGRFKVVFVNWGQEVGLTRDLIEDLGVGDHVLWIDPLPKRELWHAYCSADCVIDQFVLPCIGGVTIEVLALGRCPVITHLDSDVMDGFFGSTPPLFNCSTPEQIASAMETVIVDPEAARRVAERSREWLDTYHSHQLVQRTHVRAYEKAGLFA